MRNDVKVVNDCLHYMQQLWLQTKVLYLVMKMLVLLVGFNMTADILWVCWKSCVNIESNGTRQTKTDKRHDKMRIQSRSKGI